MINAKEIITKTEYDFLRDNKRLGDNIMFLCVSGSHGYGTNDGSSDIDIRGIAANSGKEIILSSSVDWAVNNQATDTVIYSFHKAINMLMKSNPTVLGTLFLLEEAYIHTDAYGRMLLDNRDIFLSKHAFYSYIGWAQSTLLRLDSTGSYNEDESRRRINKMAMHAVRILNMCIELLETGSFHTYRTHDHDLLMDIKRGKYMNEYGSLSNAYYGMVSELKRHAERAAAKSDLPDKPDVSRIEDLVIRINTDIVLNDSNLPGSLEVKK